MRTWRVALLFGLLLSCASEARAFDFDIHVEITRAGIVEALDNLGREDAKARQDIDRAWGSRVTTFSPVAIREIGDANKSVDTGDCGREDDPQIPARPCTKWLFESLAAFEYLAEEPPDEHFDGETIWQSSDLIFEARGRIRNYLKQGNFVGARKALGRALHAIQDFYSHTNYVELLDDRSLDIDSRLGESKGSFLRPGGRPRVAAPNEPTCLEGEYLFTNDLKRRLTELLKETQDGIPDLLMPGSRIDARSKVKRIEKALEALEPVLRNPALTSGFFVLDLPVASLFGVPIGSDATEVTDVGKCRHGWQRGGMDQAGIHKDLPDRPGHAKARILATRHTWRFLVDVMRDPELREDPEYGAYVLGLMGYELPSVMEEFTLGVPGAPNGASWDTVLGGLFTLNLKNIQPDIFVCFESANLPSLCAPPCPDADWSNELNAYVCRRDTTVAGSAVLAERDLRVTVREMDLGVPVRTIASFRVDDPRKCDPFCTVELEPGRAVWVQFKLRPVSRYSGPRRRQAVTLERAESVPVASPSSGFAAPGAPAQPVAPATPSGPSPSGAPNLRAVPAPAGAAPPGAPARSAASISARFALRDSDNCTGSDVFYPASTALAQTAIARQLGPDQAGRVFQMAAFALAIADTNVRPLILNEVRARVGDDAFFEVMTQVIGNPTQSRTLVSAYQDVAADIASRVVSGGLDRMMPVPKPPTAIRPDVDRWILQRLQPPLISRAVDLMASGPRPLTAECTLNQLAKEGFTETVLGR